MGNIKSNTINGEYNIKRLDKDRLKDLDHLSKSVYGKAVEKQYYFRKYNTGFTGIEYIGYIAYNSLNIPVSFYGVLPCFIQFNGKIILSAQSADTMTHPDHRNKGLFVELAMATFNLCKENGIGLVFGFPNQNSLHGFVYKLGWTITENMTRFSIPVRTFPFASFFKYFRWSKWIYAKYTQLTLRKYLLPLMELSKTTYTSEFGGVYRDEHYLKYKTYNQTYAIGIGNAKAWVKIKNGFIIGDLDLANDQFDLVIRELKKISGRLGISNISFQVSPGTSLHSLFSNTYQPFSSFPVGFKDLGAGIPLEKIKFAYADIDIF